MTKAQFATLPLLCAGNPTALVETVERSTGLARRRIDHFVWVARCFGKFPGYQIERLGIVPEGLVRPMLRPNESSYCFLAYLLTGDESFAADGRSRLFDLADSVAVREKTDWAQMHTWCDAFPFARWLLLSDWIWSSPALTAKDKAILEERFLYYLWAHPYQRLLGRPLAGTPCNNQNAAMAMACVAGGYLFGLKHGDSPRARKLLALGLPHLVRFVTAFPRGGYSFEGSNYMAGVNSFLIPFAIDLVEAASGEDVMDMRESEQCASPREVLQAIMRLTTPSGLTLPWDCAGYARAEFSHAAAYQAFRSGDSGALEFLDSIGEVERPSHTGWGFDKTLWTLLWTLRSGENSPQDACSQWTLNHAEPSIGAGAHGPSKRLFFFQMWDLNHWPPGRSQFNPNSIIMTFDGAPLLLDGQCVEVAKAEKFEHPDCQYFAADLQKKGNFGIGTVGAHNSLIFDDDEHFAPRSSTQGKLVISHYQPGVSLFEGDVTDCYNMRYDVRSVRRASLVLGDDLVLVRDSIESDTPHKVTWRAHVREGWIQSAPGYFSVTTPEHACLEICISGSEPIEHVCYPSAIGQPSILPLGHSGPSQNASVLAVNILEGRCYEVSHHAKGQSLTRYTLLVPNAGLQLWRKLDGPWQWLAVETPEQVDEALQIWPGGQPIDFSQASWFYSTGRHEPGIGLYRCDFEVTESLPGSMWIELPRMVRSSRVRINGREFPITLGHEVLPLLPHQIEIGSALRLGINIVEIIAPSTLECALCGEILLFTSASQSPPSRLVQKDATTLELHHHGVCDVVKWSGQECLIQRSNGQTLRIPIAEQPAASLPGRNKEEHFRLEKLVSEKSLTSGGPTNWDWEHALNALKGDDWPSMLDTLEKVAGTTDAAIVEAVWNLFQREHKIHETLPRRAPQDICWYRLKAAAARVLGAARFEPATDMLGDMVLSTDMYPSRVACAWALGQIATPRALDYLTRVSEADEWNTMTESKYWLNPQNSRHDACA